MPTAARKLRWMALLSLTLFWWMPATGARAIDIVVVYEEDEIYADDPDGSRAMAIFEAAATIWEDILEGSGTYTVGICYQDLGEGLGLWSYDPFGYNDISVNSNPSSPWWFDDTPFDDSEFSFTMGGADSGQTRYLDLTQQQKDEWFDGVPPATLEVGYRGTATVFSKAYAKFDMLSTAIHELGHELGINPVELDFEFEFYEEHIGGAVSEVQSDISGHILPTMALMCESCGDEGVRRKPTMTDILAIAYDQNITNVDLPRNEFLGVAGNNFNLNVNWFGNRMPESDDVAYLRTPQGVPLVITVGTALDVLEMDGVNMLSTGANVLSVVDKIHVQGGGELSIDAGGLAVSDLFQVDDATVSLGGGTLQVGSYLLLADASSRVRGFGTVNLGGTLHNNGSIAAENGTLLMDGSAAWNFDMDGVNDNGQLYAEDGDLTIRGVSTPFNGELFVLSHTARFEDGWTLGSQGHAVLTEAVLAGGTFASGKQINLEGQVDVPSAIVTADVRLGPTAVIDINAPSTFSISQLEFAGRTHYDGARVVGDILMQTGVATVVSDTSIDVAFLDLDGDAESSAVTTINPSVFFSIDKNGMEMFDGLLHIDGGVLVHNFSATFPSFPIGGTLRFSDGGQFQGSAIDMFGTIDMTGTGGTAVIAAPLTLNTGSSVVVPTATDVLELAGDMTIDGSTSFLGFGTLRQVGNLTVNSSTTLGGVLAYDWDGSELSPSTTTIGPGVVFTLSPHTINAGSTGSDGHDGMVNVNGGTLLVNLPAAAASWRLDGTLNLTQNGTAATVGGSSPLVLAGTVRVAGLGVVGGPIQFLSGSRVVVNTASDTLRLTQATTYSGGSYTGGGMIEQRGSATVTANTSIAVATYDWDGLGGASAPTTTVLAGASLTLNVGRIENTATPASDGVSGMISVLGGTLVVNTPQPWRLDGTLNLNQIGAFLPMVGGSQMVNHGTIRVTGEARINAPVELQGNSMLQAANLSDTLVLAGATTYREDAALSGAGTIVQAGAATMTAPTTINVSIFDWDGEEASPSSTLADLSQSLFDNAIRINSTQIERGDPTLDGYDGTLTLRGMELIVNTSGPWRLDGTLIPVEDGFDVPRVSGAPLVVYGTIDPQGDAVFDTAIELRAGSLVRLNTGDRLTFDKALTYLGGEVSGPGVVVHNFEVTVDADTTISVATLDLDGSGERTSLKLDEGRLTLNVNNLDFGDNVVDGDVVLGNLLAVNTPAAWTTQGELRLSDAGALVGAGLTANGPISGNGVLKPTTLSINGGLYADAGTLRISSDSFPDLDGVSNTGDLEAFFGGILITSVAGAVVPFGGKLDIGNGHSFTMDYDGLSVTGSLLLKAGTFSAPMLDLQPGGQMQVTQRSTLDADGTLRAGSLTTLEDDLDVVRSITVEGMASATGDGDLVINGSATFEGDPTLHVGLRNDGTVRPGLRGPGILTVVDFAQSASGTLEIEIGGIMPGTGFDQLLANGSADLSGELVVELTGGFIPNESDEFKILSAGMLTNKFDNVENGGRIGTVAGEGLFTVTYNAGADFVQLSDFLFIGQLGDYSGNGTVDAADYTVWQDTLGASVVHGLAADGDASGTVDAGDYTVWKANFGTTTAAVGAASRAAQSPRSAGHNDAVPEPASALVLLFVAVGLLLSSHRRAFRHDRPCAD